MATAAANEGAGLPIAKGNPRPWHAGSHQSERGSAAPLDRETPLPAPASKPLVAMATGTPTGEGAGLARGAPGGPGPGIPGREDFPREASGHGVTLVSRLCDRASEERAALEPQPCALAPLRAERLLFRSRRAGAVTRFPVRFGDARGSRQHPGAGPAQRAREVLGRRCLGPREPGGRWARPCGDPGALCGACGTRCFAALRFRALSHRAPFVRRNVCSEDGLCHSGVSQVSSCCGIPRLALPWGRCRQLVLELW